MLYKKTHRQYLREFRVGRKLKYIGGGVYRIIEKPHIRIERNYICVGHWDRISLITGQCHYNGTIVWLED